MRKEQITDKEAFCMAFLFISGSTLILGVGGDAKNNAWMAGIAGAIMAAPMILVYSRIVSLFPSKDLFEILECVLGCIPGKIVCIIYVWYAFHLGVLVFRNFGEFVSTVALPETPMLASIFVLGLVCIYNVKSGVEVISRISAYFLPVLILIIIVVQLLTLPSLEPKFLKPFLGEGLMPVLKGGFDAFAFPFGETVILMGCFFSLKTKKSPYKIYFSAVFLACTLIVLLTLRNIMILGSTIQFYYFPSHIAVSRISVGEFIQRIELTVALVFIICVLIKSSVCLLVTCRGISRIFRLQDYRSIVIQVGLLMVFMSQIIYADSMMMRYWAFNVYPYYAVPFQVIIPIAVWITAEIRKKKLVCQNSASAAQQDS
jgi:spore germination protein KB